MAESIYVKISSENVGFQTGRLARSIELAWGTASHCEPYKYRSYYIPYVIDDA